MAVRTESNHPGAYIIEQIGSNNYCNEQVMITGGKYEAGQVLGKLTADGKYTAYTPDADPADGSETAVAILHTGVDASATDKRSVISARGVVVNGQELVGLDEAAIAALADKDIIVRQA
ncbi:MAG: head decoration protein [Oceanospirillaceae bacterium]|nr:head decoration protein [Oceanospirillaceae bacterium]